MFVRLCVWAFLSKTVFFILPQSIKHGKARSLSQTTSTAPFSLAGNFLHLLCNSEKGKKETGFSHCTARHIRLEQREPQQNIKSEQVPRSHRIHVKSQVDGEQLFSGDK